MHITETYKSLQISNEKIVQLESINSEMQDAINALKKSLRREQNNFQKSKRSLYAQKGIITRRINALDLETSNRDLELNNSKAQIVKQRGYNKTIATKLISTSERESLKIKANKINESQNKISLPLLIFDCLKESILLINIYKTSSSMRSALSKLIPLLIPPSVDRKEIHYSNHKK